MDPRILRHFTIWLSLLGFCVLLTNCRTIKNHAPSEYDIVPVDKDSFHLLNGSYADRGDTVFGGIVHNPYTKVLLDRQSLLDRLFMFFPDSFNRKDIVVTFNFISPSKLQVTAQTNGINYFTKKVRGKFKGGYFVRRPLIFIVPFFPFMYLHDFETLRIGKIKDGIIVDHGMRMWGFFFIAGASDNGTSSTIYKSKVQ